MNEYGFNMGLIIGVVSGLIVIMVAGFAGGIYMSKHTYRVVKTSMGPRIVMGYTIENINWYCAMVSFCPVALALVVGARHVTNFISWSCGTEAVATFFVVITVGIVIADIYCGLLHFVMRRNSQKLRKELETQLEQSNKVVRWWGDKK